MNSGLLLLAHSLRRVRILIVATGVLLAGFQCILILVAASVQKSNAFGQMEALIPPVIRELMGPAITGMMSFGGVVCLGYFHLAVMGSLVALSIALATMPVSEIETGSMDLLLSRPVARHRIITRSILLLVICVATLVLAMMLGTWIGLNTLAPAGAVWPRAALVRSLALNLGLLVLSLGALAMAIGAASRRRATASALSGLFAVTMFLLDYIAQLWKPAKPFAWISPFHYFVPFDLLLGKPLVMKNIAVLATIAVAGFAATYVLFSRRDITH